MGKNGSVNSSNVLEIEAPEAPEAPPETEEETEEAAEAAEAAAEEAKKAAEAVEKQAAEAARRAAEAIANAPFDLNYPLASQVSGKRRTLAASAGMAYLREDKMGRVVCSAWDFYSSAKEGLNWKEALAEARRYSRKGTNTAAEAARNIY